MFSRKVPEVLVVGGGPVGLFAALALTSRGIRVQIVEKGVWACAHSYALALHPETVRLFNELGLRERVMDSAWPVRSLGLYDRDGRRAQICLAEAMPVLRQDVLERLLESALAEQGVPVLWRHAVSALSQGEHAVAATIDRYEEESRGYVVARSEWMVADSSEVQAPFVIGADGYNSLVRRRSKLEYNEVAPPRYYAVFEFKSDDGAGDEAKIVLGDTTTDVLWPVSDGYRRWSFELPEHPEAVREKERRPSSNAEHAPVLEEENLRALIAARAPWFTGSIGKFTWRTLVRFEHRLASAFGRGRAWLAGDAAHVTSPAGVQSMNAGFSEARDLAETTTRVLRGGCPPDLLNAYNERWMATWRQLHGLERGLTAGPQTDPWIEARRDRILSCLPGHGAQLSALAGQLGLAI